MREWNRLVQQTYKDGKAKSPIYSLGDAMKDARKVYKKGKAVAENVVEKIGRTGKANLTGKARHTRKTRRTGKSKKHHENRRRRGTRRN
jgi:hypothetical protein